MNVRSVLVLVLAASVSLATGPRAAGAADDATAQARSHYEVGLRLFDAREHEQALIEFRQANELKPRPAALFMMAQCEYLLGQLKDARAHYARYATENPDGEFVALARDRIESIDKRPSTFVINSVPDDVTVHIVATPAPGQPQAAPIVGQAPNNFQVPRGRYRIDVTKANYQGQTREVDVDIAETKPLFFKLDPIPARLEIETAPPWATLYVNGNRARNPYRQDVVPGHYEIFAEAPDYEDRTIGFSLVPGEQKMLMGPNRIRLSYAQRSGRPELLFASALIGGFVGAGAVAAAIGSDLDGPNVASVLLLGGGGVAGIIAGALIATPLVPRYIPDNRALFILGAMWMGAAEGALTGIIWRQVSTHNGMAVAPCSEPCRGPIGEQLRAGFVGSLPGLALGLTAGSLLADRAPTYGRVALIQSAALGGALTGALVQMATRWTPYGPHWGNTIRKIGENEAGNGTCVDIGTKDARCAYPESSVLDLMPGALIGLNLGLTAGLLGAYLPDQTRYGPTWKRVLLIDLAAGAGALAGGVFGCVAQGDKCLTSDPLADARGASALAAIGGGAVGLIGGVLLTRHYDDDQQQPGRPTTAMSLSATVGPVRAPDGRTTPGLSAFGTF